MNRKYFTKKPGQAGHKNPFRQKTTRKIWVGEERVIRKHFSHIRGLLISEQARDRSRYEEEVLKLLPEQREKHGKALRGLEILEVHYNPSGQRMVTFKQKGGKRLPRFGLNSGDIVRLSAFRIPESDWRGGVVYARSANSITVAFSGAEMPDWVQHEQFFQLTLGESRTSFERMFVMLDRVRDAKHNRLAKLRDIALGLKAPELGDPVKPEKLSFFHQGLNAEQKKAVAMALENKDVFVLHGPPGTGKTSVLVEMVRQAKERGETVLISAPSNAACDHLVECLAQCDLKVTRLGHPARVSAAVRDRTLSFQLVQHPYAKELESNHAKLDQLFKQRLRRRERREMSWEEKDVMNDEIDALKAENKEIKAQIFNEVWNSTDIVIATHVVCADTLLESKKFDWVIMDEAGQAIEPASWIPMAHAGRVVLAGDHEQLPPTVLSNYKGRGSLCYTLFERLHDVLPATSQLRLQLQYRMHEEIMRFSSDVFYEGTLTAADANRGHTLKDLPRVTAHELTEKPVVFIDTAGLAYDEEFEDGGFSRYNSGEAQIVIRQIKDLLEKGVSSSEIAVISPYSAQIKWILQKMDEQGFGGSDVEVDSVDSFQGREKEAVILSLVRSNLEGDLGFLKDVRRMNVAMTRAKRKLIVIGDSATLSSLPFYQDFLEYVERVNGYLSAWEYAQ
ncbi:MAG TPA: AAA domain-containing protein [Candidatus Omnitrophota bacterium]|nr:AAA domain-containing protein [Candidatus Omnitrophota bacterium]